MTEKITNASNFFLTQTIFFAILKLLRCESTGDSPALFFFSAKVIINKKTMTEIRIETSNEDTAAEESNCVHCAQRAQEEAESHETSFAFLLALMPLVVLTFFGQVGLL